MLCYVINTEQLVYYWLTYQTIYLYFPIVPNTSTHRARETIFVRNKNVENTKNFFEQLESTDWLQLPGYNDPKMCYDSFLNKFSQIYDTCFPLKKLKGKNQSRKPWLSMGLLKSVKRKNKLYKQYLSDPSSQKKSAA